MMLPKKGNIILAETQEPFIGYDQDEKQTKYQTCPEIVYFPEMKAIGIQYEFV